MYCARKMKIILCAVKEIRQMFVSFFLGIDLKETCLILQKLESGTPIDWFVEEHDLDARATEGLKAYQTLRDLMGEAMQSTECKTYRECQIAPPWFHEDFLQRDLLEKIY